jgi:hypothetical protein
MKARMCSTPMGADKARMCSTPSVRAIDDDELQQRELLLIHQPPFQQRITGCSALFVGFF